MASQHKYIHVYQLFKFQSVTRYKFFCMIHPNCNGIMRVLRSATGAATGSAIYDNIDKCCPVT